MSRPSTSSRFSAEAVGQRRIADRGAQVGVQREVLAQPQQARLRAHVIGHAVPLRPADRAEDHRVGGMRLGHGLVGDRHLVGVVGRRRRPALPRSRTCPCRARSSRRSAFSPRPSPRGRCRRREAAGACGSPWVFLVIFGGVLERRAPLGKLVRGRALLRKLQDTFGADVVAQARTHLHKRTHRCDGSGCAGAGASP